MTRNLRMPSTDDREAPHSSSRVVRTCARTADAMWFNLAIFAVIVINAIILGLATYDQIEQDAGDLLNLANEVILGIFVVELTIRLVGFGRRPQDFFRSGLCHTTPRSSRGVPLTVRSGARASVRRPFADRATRASMFRQHGG